MVAPPAFAIDTHAHVFTRSLALAPGRRYAPDADAPLADYLGHLDTHGLHGGVLIQPSFLGTDNSHMLAAIRQAPARLRGVAVVDAATPRIELDRLARGGIVGIRLNLIGQPLPALASGHGPALLAHVRQLDWHVEVHAEAARLAAIVAPLREAGCRVVIDHFGRPDPQSGLADPGFAWLLDAARDADIWIKLSGAYRNWPDMAGAEAREAARRLVAHAGPDRLVWGSDWPHTQHPGVTYAHTHDALARWIDDPGLRARILASNPRRCFGF